MANAPLLDEGKGTVLRDWKDPDSYPDTLEGRLLRTIAKGPVSERPARPPAQPAKAATIYNPVKKSWTDTPESFKDSPLMEGLSNLPSNILGTIAETGRSVGTGLGALAKITAGGAGGAGVAMAGGAQTATSKAASKAAAVHKGSDKERVTGIMVANGISPEDANKQYDLVYGSGDRSGDVKAKLEREWDTHTPLDSYEENIYTQNEQNIFQNTGAMGKLHDEIIGLQALSEEKIQEKARREADNIEQEQELQHLKQADNELQADTTSANRAILEERLNQASALYDQKLLKYEQDEEGMSGWEIFKKSAIAIAAIAAAGGTVMGQFAMGRKYGGMPNVLMPLVNKAIDADIRATQEGGAKIKGEVDAARELHRGYMQIFKDKKYADEALRADLHKFWDSRLETYKTRLPEGGKKALLEDTQKNIRLQQKQSELALRKAFMGDLKANTDAMVNSIKKTEDFKGAFVARAHNAVLALQAHKNYLATGKEERPKINEKTINQLSEQTRALNPIASIKERMVKLINKYDYNAWTTAADITFGDLIGNLVLEEDRAMLLGVQADLKLMATYIGQAVEQRLTNEDRTFYEEVQGADLKNVHLVDAYVRLMGSEYYLRQGILDTASKMPPAQLKQHEDSMAAALRKHPTEALKNYTASIAAVISNPNPKSRATAYDVGMRDIGAAELRFKDKDWGKIQQNLMARFITNINQPSGQSMVKQNRARAIEERTRDGVSKNRPNAGLIQIPTEGNQPAYLKAEAGAAFNAMAQAAARDGGVHIRASGPGGGFRTPEETKSLQARGYGAATGGGHTEEGGANSVDIVVHQSNKSGEFKWLMKNGARFGFTPVIYKDKSGKTIYHHWKYAPSEKKG